MISIDLVSEPVDTKEFHLTYTKGKCNFALFLGFVIKNEYDNRRLKISERYTPVRLLHTIEKDILIPLYGTFLTPNKNIKQLYTVIEDQQQNTLNLLTYKNILSQFNLTCDNTYSWFNKCMFPIDFNNLKSVCDDEFNTDKKIFQHILNIDENHFDFQTFASLKLFILKL